MSLVKKLNYHDGLLLEKEKILLNSDATDKKKLPVIQAPTEADIEKWKKRLSTEVAILKDWLKKQPHLPQNIRDENLLAFLHSCYNSIEQAKTKIDAYFTIRTHAPEIFSQRTISSKEMEKAQRITRISPLRCATPEGYNAIFVDSIDSDVANFSFTEAMKVAGIAIDVLVRCYPEEEGNILVFDMQRSVLAHVIKTNLTVLKKAMIYVQKALPFRLKQVHVINAFPLIQQIQLLLKPFIDDKLSKMIYGVWMRIFRFLSFQIHIHMQDNMDTLYDFIPKNRLPKEYGGEGESLQELNGQLNEMIYNNESYLKELETLVVDESRRIGKAQTSSDVFGMEGSFRRLEID